VTEEDRGRKSLVNPQASRAARRVTTPAPLNRRRRLREEGEFLVDGVFSTMLPILTRRLQMSRTGDRR
jgi:hypothetical protein